MKQYRAAIVGLGNIAWKFDKEIKGKFKEPLTHAGAYLASPKTVLVGGCSPDSKDREAFEQHHDLSAFDSIHELISETNPDIISICSPTELHFEHVMSCLEARMPMIWLEKPPTLRIEQLDELIDKQRSTGASRILVNYHRRYSEPYIKLKNVVAKDIIGKAVFANLTYSRGLVPNGSHIIDIIFSILGDNQDAILEFATFSTGEENPSFLLRFPDEFSAFVTGMSLPYHCVDISITCESGRASVLYGGMETCWELKIEHELFPGFYRLKRGNENLLGVGGYDSIMITALDDLINAYEDHRDPVSNLSTARRTHLVLDEIEKWRRGSK